MYKKLISVTVFNVLGEPFKLRNFDCTLYLLPIQIEQSSIRQTEIALLFHKEPILLVNVTRKDDIFTFEQFAEHLWFVCKIEEVTFVSGLHHICTISFIELNE